MCGGIDFHMAGKEGFPAEGTFPPRRRKGGGKVYGNSFPICGNSCCFHAPSFGKRRARLVYLSVVQADAFLSYVGKPFCVTKNKGRPPFYPYQSPISPCISRFSKAFFLLTTLFFSNPLMPRGHLLSLPPEKGGKESAKGGIVFPPFEPPTKSLRRVS